MKFLTIQNTKLGTISIAAKDETLFGLEFGDNSKEVLKNSFVETNCDISIDLVSKVLSAANFGDFQYIETKITGSSFVKDVLEAIKAVQPGETASYSQIAKLIGKPNAYRAVGTACSKNPIGLIIPCHRITKADGKRSGFKWGKQVLDNILKLEKENKAVIIEND